MGNEHSLLERMIMPVIDKRYSIVIDEALQVDSILQHIQKLLNVRQGSVDMLFDYGLPDFNDLSNRFPYAINEIKKEITACIKKYEPRLTQIRVNHVQDEDDPLFLRYDITAKLVINHNKTNIWFETVLDTAGKVSIKGN